MLEGHGSDLHRYKGLVKVDFSSNICPGLSLAGLKSHLSERMGLIEHYPEPEPLELERAIAAHNGVDRSNVMVTNGATGAIYLTARSLAHDTSGEPFRHIIAQPTFSEYADACRLCGIVPLADGTGVAGRKAHWLCNPNNPTGSHIAADEILGMAHGCPNDVFVIDQSYWQYCEERPVSPAEAATMKNIIIINSFSKDYGVPGLRLGWLTGNASLVSQMRRFSQPWSIGALDLEAGLFLENGGNRAQEHIAGILREARRLRKELDSIDGVTAFDTRTNFMLCHLDCGSAASLKDYLVKRHGFLIRDAANFASLDSRYFRVAAQSAEADDNLVSAIRRYTEGTRQAQAFLR